MAAMQIRSAGLSRLHRFVVPRNLRLVSTSGKEVQEITEHARQTSYNWKLISLFVAAPSMAFLMYKNFFSEEEHSEEHKEFVPYKHLRIRNKPFPWGDGDKSLFHNPHANIGPDSETEEEVAKEVPIEERLPLLSKIILYFMEDAAEIKKRQDAILRRGFANTLQYIELRKRDGPPAIIGEFHENQPVKRDVSVDGY